VAHFQIKVIIFTLASAGFIWVSWPSLRNFRSHGFYRLFAWQSILILILLNIDYWLTNPFGIYQIISWLLLTNSLYLVIYGYLSLRRSLKSYGMRDDPLLKSIERTSVLVTDGAYRYIRHPIYSAGLFGTWGIFFKRPSLASVCLSMTATALLIITAKMEEAENIIFFGNKYQKYMERTKMLIPLLF